MCSRFKVRGEVFGYPVVTVISDVVMDVAWIGAPGEAGASATSHAGLITASGSRPRSSSRMIAALRPGAPVMEPPGWVVPPVW